MTLFTDLRDGAAANLIAQFGQDATLRQETVTYDPATGIGTPTNKDTAVKVVTVPMTREFGGARDQERVNMVAQFGQMVLMSAKETAAASVVPTVQDKLIVGGDTSRIVAIVPIAPDGTVVVYKMGIERT
jgi:hypothetical protein